MLRIRRSKNPYARLEIMSAREISKMRKNLGLGDFIDYEVVAATVLLERYMFGGIAIDGIIISSWVLIEHESDIEYLSAAISAETLHIVMDRMGMRHACNRFDKTKLHTTGYHMNICPSGIVESRLSNE